MAMQQEPAEEELASLQEKARSGKESERIALARDPSVPQDILDILLTDRSMLVQEQAQREAAAVTFLVAASGVTLLGVSGAFWGLLAGGAMLALASWRRGPRFPDGK